MVNNPEFLRRSAVKDFMEPDGVVVGYKDTFVKETFKELFLTCKNYPYLEMSNLSIQITVCSQLFSRN